MTYSFVVSQWNCAEVFRLFGNVKLSWIVIYMCFNNHEVFFF